MRTNNTVILIHPDAPPKPAWGQACNGCGVCCAYAPCPVGVLVSKRLHGSCAALVWVDGESRYRCGVIQDPGRFTGLKSPRTQAWAVRVARRMISAGSGCDCSLDTGRNPA